MTDDTPRAFYCPHCKEELEFSFKISLLTVAPENAWRAIPLAEMNIPVRAKNALKKYDANDFGLETAGDIDSRTDHQLLSFPNMGWKSVREVRAEIDRLKKEWVAV